MNSPDSIIYLDNAATTQVSRQAAQAAWEQMVENYGNPSSLHRHGLSAELAVEKAREQLAGALGSSPDEIVFTSGGTEANNLALLGAVAAYHRRGKTIVTTAAEHSSVLHPLKHLEEQGYRLIQVPPTPQGELDVKALVEAVDDDTVLVSAMLVNSETGAISDIAAAVSQVKEKNKRTLFHTDGVQAFGKLPFTVRQLGVDLLSVSGHKLHGPKGVGALYIKKGVRVLPLVYGGGQEQGLWSGTEPVPQIVAFGCAADTAYREMSANLKHLRNINEYFMNKVKNLPDVCSNSPPKATPYIQSLSVLGYRSEILLHHLAEQGIYVSSGSACSRGKRSHVLSAMGLSDERIDSALRVSFSRYTTTQEIDALIDALKEGQSRLIKSL